MFEIEPSLLPSCDAIFHYGWGSCIQHRITDVADRPNSWDSGSICKQTAKYLTSEKLVDLIVNEFLFTVYKYQFMDVYSTVSYHFIENFFQTISEKN